MGCAQRLDRRLDAGGRISRKLQPWLPILRLDLHGPVHGLDLSTSHMHPASMNQKRKSNNTSLLRTRLLPPRNVAAICPHAADTTDCRKCTLRRGLDAEARGNALGRVHCNACPLLRSGCTRLCKVLGTLGYTSRQQVPFRSTIIVGLPRRTLRASTFTAPPNNGHRWYGLSRPSRHATKQYSTPKDTFGSSPSL
jgi:hypothetical protein